MWKKFLQKLANKCVSRQIYRRDGRLYLTRYYLFRKSRPWMPSIYLHQFHSSDEDPELHSHPWKLSFSLILLGRYYEHYLKNNKVLTRILGPWNINVVSQNKLHRVDLLDKEVWTLFVSGPKVADWGFLNTDTNEYLHWEEHIKRKNLEN